MDLKLVAVGLISSLLTVVIQKLLEILQNNKEHKNQLRKTYFEKKIIAGELAVSQFTILRSALINLSTFYKNIINMSSNVGNDVIQNMVLQFNTQLQNAQSATFQLANSIYLYFDLDDEDLFKEESSSRVIVKLEEIGQNLESYNRLLAAYDRATTSETLKALNDETDKIEKQMEVALNEISELTNKSGETYKKMVAQIRSEMKKFEPKI